MSHRFTERLLEAGDDDRQDRGGTGAGAKSSVELIASSEVQRSDWYRPGSELFKTSVKRAQLKVFSVN